MIQALIQILKNFLGKAFQVRNVLMQDAHHHFRLDAGIVVNNNVAELGHLRHGIPYRFSDDAVFVKNQKKVFIVFGFAKAAA